MQLLLFNVANHVTVNVPFFTFILLWQGIPLIQRGKAKRGGGVEGGLGGFASLGIVVRFGVGELGRGVAPPDALWEEGWRPQGLGRKIPPPTPG